LPGSRQGGVCPLSLGHRGGHWAMLPNPHLMSKWGEALGKKLDSSAIEGSRPNLRCFLSADTSKGIPIGILGRSIKLAHEPSRGILASLCRAFAIFIKEDFEDRDAKVRAIVFGNPERKKFGPMGYNMLYPFSAADLRGSSQVLDHYLAGSSAGKIPWDALRCIFGEILYGGHLVHDRDRTMCTTYLLVSMVDELLDETEMVLYA